MLFSNLSLKIERYKVRKLDSTTIYIFLSKSTKQFYSLLGFEVEYTHCKSNSKR